MQQMQFAVVVNSFNPKLPRVYIKDRKARTSRLASHAEEKQ